MADKFKFLGDQTEQEFIGTARQHYHDGMEADREDRDEAQHDNRFLSGGDYQWDEVSLKQRRPDDKSKPRRPVLTWNRLHEPVYQVCNDGRANKPGIRVTAGDGGDPHTAEYFQSRIRQIEYETDGDIAYDTAREQAVSTARAFIRVRTDYESVFTFRQKIHIDEIPNQFSVVWDPAGQLYDLEDSEWWFVFGRISEESYKRKYGQEALDAYVAFCENPAANSGEWMREGGMIPEVEYWVKTYKPDTLLLLANGTEVLQSRTMEGLAKTAVKKREVEVPRIVQYMIDGAQILKETEWIGSRVPIIPQWGDKKVVDGKARTFSLIRHAKDPQKIVNLTVSNIAELTAQIPKTRYRAAEGQLAGHEDEWEPNSPHIVKYYRMKDDQGNPYLEAPQSDAAEAPIQALSVQLAQAVDATKQGTGIFNAALGDRSNETSGKAINARKIESDVSTFHFHDNESRTRKSIGKILVEIIPIIDKGRQEVPVRDADGKTRTVKLKQPFKNDKGEEVTINPEKGNYHVNISTGPSYTSQRQEAFEAYSDIAQHDKNFMGIAGDLFFRTMDAPGAEEIADRYEAVVIPPQVRKPKDGKPSLPPEAQQVIQMAQQNIQKLNRYAQELERELNDAKLELKTRMQEKQMEIRSKEKISYEQELTKRVVAETTAKTQSGIALLNAKIAELEKRMEMATEMRNFHQGIINQEQERGDRLNKEAMDRDFNERQMMAQNQPEQPEMQPEEMMPPEQEIPEGTPAPPEGGTTNQGEIVE